MKQKDGKHANTFVVKIIDQKNSTWQGSVTWAEEKKAQNFRSTLELLKLISGALEHVGDGEGESYEE